MTTPWLEQRLSIHLLLGSIPNVVTRRDEMRISELTQRDLDHARDVLECIVDHMEETEPHAVNSIEIWREAAQSLPSLDELQER